MTDRNCPHCGAVLVGDGNECVQCLLDAPLPSVMLTEHLELGELLGEGAMGAVFRATDHNLGRDVAVKLLSSHERAEGRASLAARLTRESRALALLDHPGIVTLFESGEADGQPYLVMSLIEGPSLRQAPQTQPEEIRDLGIQLCRALQYAHERGIVHRDLKPENVLIRPDGSYVLADFGIARSLTPGTNWTLTETNLTAGSPHYMAPEALKGAAPDPRMDVYGVGVILYEQLRGELPQGAFAPLDGAWDTIIRGALAPDPEVRYADAAALEKALVSLPMSGGGAISADSEQLSTDEGSFVKALAGLQTVATAVTIWALYLCVMPLAIDPSEVEPLTMLPERTPLADGRVITYARFVPGPVLGAVLANAIAILAYGFLRRHWRREGLERFAPDSSVPISRWVLYMGFFNISGFFGRMLLGAAGFETLAAFAPIVGGLSEALTIYLTWLSLLELWRNRRPIVLEWQIWVGLSLSVVPPIHEYFRYLSAWNP